MMTYLIQSLLCPGMQVLFRAFVFDIADESLRLLRAQQWNELSFKPFAIDTSQSILRRRLSIINLCLQKMPKQSC